MLVDHNILIYDVLRTKTPKKFEVFLEDLSADKIKLVSEWFSKFPCCAILTRDKRFVERNKNIFKRAAKERKTIRGIKKFLIANYYTLRKVLSTLGRASLLGFFASRLQCHQHLFESQIPRALERKQRDDQQQ